MKKRQPLEKRSGGRTPAYRRGTPANAKAKCHRAKTKASTEPSLGKIIADRLNEFADAAESGEPLSARFTCRKVILNLVPMPYDPGLVKKTRAILSVSQNIFAQFLGVSVDTVQAWESGVNTPSDMACRFMDEIRHDPEYWRTRLTDSISQKVEETAGL